LLQIIEYEMEKTMKSGKSLSKLMTKHWAIHTHTHTHTHTHKQTNKQTVSSIFFPRLLNVPDGIIDIKILKYNLS